MVLAKRNIVFSIVFIVCVSVMMTNVQAFFGGKSDVVVDALDKQVAEKAQEYESIITGLKSELAETTKKLDQANIVIKDLNKKVADVEKLLGDYKSRIIAIQEQTRVPEDEAVVVEESTSTLAGLMSKMKEVVSADDEGGEEVEAAAEKEVKE